MVIGADIAALMHSTPAVRRLPRLCPTAVLPAAHTTDATPERPKSLPSCSARYYQQLLALTRGRRLAAVPTFQSRFLRIKFFNCSSRLQALMFLSVTP